MEKLECVMQCEPEAYMDILSPDKYIPAQQLNDGTKKCYKCNKCNGIFFLDKMTRQWQISAETYTNLVEEGLLEDKLS